MNTNEHESEKSDRVIEQVIGAAYEVSNVLGAGFLERSTNARARELALRGLKAAAQVAYPVP